MSSAEAEQFKNQGNAALNRGDFPEAIKAYTEAIRLDPSNHIYYSNRAAAYTSCSLIEQAIADAKKTIELQPKWAKGYSRLGAAYARQGDIEGAQKAYEDGLTHCPDDTSLKQGIAHLEGMMQQQQRMSSAFAWPHTQSPEARSLDIDSIDRANLWADVPQPARAPLEGPSHQRLVEPARLFCHG